MARISPACKPPRRIPPGLGGSGLPEAEFEKLCEAVGKEIEKLKVAYKAGMRKVLLKHKKKIGQLADHQVEEFYNEVVAGSGISYGLFTKIHAYGAGVMSKVAFEKEWVTTDLFLRLPEETQKRINADATTVVIKKNTAVEKNFSKVTAEEAKVIFDYDRPERGEIPPHERRPKTRQPKYLRIINVLEDPNDARYLLAECVGHNMRQVVRTSVKELAKIIKKFS